MRLAFFGGSFDPPHRGHSAVALSAADSLRLDRVIFAPTGRQPMKPLGASADYADRIAMTSLVCAEDSRFETSRVDAPRPDHRANYTVEALELLRSEFPTDRLFAIVGADSFFDLPRWHRADDLLLLAEWIVVSRPGFGIRAADVERLLQGRVSRVHLLNGVMENVSATDLRERLARAEDCSELLLPAVSSYIEQHHLYR